MSNLVIHGLYSIKDTFFSEFGKGYWVNNKNEKRPYYYLFRDQDGVCWVIPMSTQVDNYRRKIKKVEEKRGEGNCIYYHLGKIANIERVFLIGDMFPIDDTYIKNPFTINSIHYVVKNRKLNDELHRKAMRFIKLVESGAIKSRNDILGIKRVLANRKTNRDFIV